MQTENHTIPSRKGSTVTETIDIFENNYIKEEMIKVETIKKPPAGDWNGNHPQSEEQWQM